MENNSKYCHWFQEDDWEYSSRYETECGDGFSLEEGTPEENGMKFCCYCGKPLLQVLFEIEEE